MDQKKLEELMQDEGFVNQIASMGTKEEIQQAFKSKGLEVSVEELDKLEAGGKKALDEAELELVSGGGGATVSGVSSQLNATVNNLSEAVGQIMAQGPQLPSDAEVENLLDSASNFHTVPKSSSNPGAFGGGPTLGVLIVGGILAAGAAAYGGYKYYQKRKNKSGTKK